METQIIQLTTLTPRKRTFGEYLVEQRVLDRFQLFRALQMQDRMPGARLGHCAVALGFAPRAAIEKQHVRFEHATIDAFEAMQTDAFDREGEIEVEIVYPLD
jgi:hypothetical protein